MINAVEQLNTKYLAAHYSNDARKLMQGADVVDMAGARICRGVMRAVIDGIQEGVLVIDSVDAQQDAYLKETKRRLELQKELKNTIQLPLPVNIEQTVDFIKLLRPVSTYEITSGSNALYAYAIITQAIRPEIKLHLGSGVAGVLSMVYRYLFPNEYRWDEFYRIEGMTFVVEKPPADQYETYVQENVVVPTVFGQRKLLELPEWENCIAKVSDVYERSFRERNRKIKDYLLV